jgi:hypothetical protein
MDRKTYLSIPVVLIGALILAILGIVAWVILAIPLLVKPDAVPDPRSVVMNSITRHAIKNMMKGGAASGKAAA